jgi:hypothetical protein
LLEVRVALALLDIRAIFGETAVRRRMRPKLIVPFGTQRNLGT